MRIAAVLLTVLLAGCFPVRPDTSQSRACTARAELVADSKYRAGESLEVVMAWLQHEGRAYDECMTK